MTVAPPPAGMVHDDGSRTRAVGDPLCTRYDVALLDLDGVVYRGADPVPDAPSSLAAARSAGMPMAFVTNNASRTPDQIVHHLRQLGVAAQPSEVVTSAQAAATLAAERLGPGGRVFVVGGDGLRDAIAAVDLRLVERYDEEPAPEMVVQGFSPDLRYEDLAQAALVVARGAEWIATNSDATLPTARGLQPGNGTLVAAVAAAAGRLPLVAGKPHRALVDEAVRRSDARRPLMVGDRLDTDIEGAVRANIDSLLVLTGVSTVADLLTAAAAARPTYLGADLSALLQAPTSLDEVGAAAVTARSGWRADTVGGVVRLSSDDDDDSGSGKGDGKAVPPGADPLDIVRTLVVAAWRSADAGHPVTAVTVPAACVQQLVKAGVPEALLRTDDAHQGSAAQAGDVHAGR